MTENGHSEDSYDSLEQELQWQLWGKLIRYARPYRLKVALLGVAAVATAGIETIFPLLTRQVIDEVAARGAEAELFPYGLAYFGLVVVLSLCVLSFISLAGTIRTHVSHDIREAGFANLQRLSYTYFDRRPVGWLMARMTSDCDRLSNILAWGTLDLIWGFTLMGGIALAMLVMDFALGCLVLAVIPPLVWVSRIFSRKILKSSRLIRKTNSRLTASYNEGLMGVRTSKAFIREPENLEDFTGLSGEMYEVSLRNALHSALYLPIVLTLGSLATGVALAMGGLDVVSGALSVGTLIAFMSYVRHFFDPIQEIANLFAQMQMAQASAERILGLIETVPEIKDRPELARIIERNRGVERAAGLAEDGHPEGIGCIELRDVSFAYQGGEPVLVGFDLTVEKGESIALVGSTGGGKSTIVNLLCRFYEPTGGCILLDGIELRARGLHWFQSQLGIVLQTPHLFSGSIADNLRYGKLSASDEEIEAAAKLVGAHDFIMATEHGYRTEVGEGGSRLSTGQKQLISFARAILVDPQILVMDEATSSVDTETEKAIQRGLERLLEGRTSFVIAHRLSTIRSVDRILVIEGGRILEQGSHAQLLARRGRYHELYTQQSFGAALSWDEPGSGRQRACRKQSGSRPGAIGLTR